MVNLSVTAQRSSATVLVAARPGFAFRWHEALQTAGFPTCVAQSGAEARRLMRVERLGAYLVDLALPDEGLTLVSDIAHQDSDARIVAVGPSGSVSDLRRTLRLGASGFLPLGPSLCAQLPRALASVLAGEVAVPRAMVGGLLAELIKHDQEAALQARAAQGRLTPREQEILALLRDGLTTGEIAAELFVSPVTVRSHVAAVMRKLHVSDREAAIDWLTPEDQPA